MISLRLGTTDCISVSDEWLIHQVLIERGEHFDARPNFLRFHLMFGGSKQNGNYLVFLIRSICTISQGFSWKKNLFLMQQCFCFLALAFCDYDEIQKIRKNLLAAHTFPRRNTLSYDKLDQVLKFREYYQKHKKIILRYLSLSKVRRHLKLTLFR